MIRVDVHCEFADVDIKPSEIEGLVRTVCGRHGVENGVISVAIVGDGKIYEINRQFLGRERTTDCISFDLSDETEERTLEIVVNGERAVHEAKIRGHAPVAELALYITHGLLHYLGFDDTTTVLAEKMHTEEDVILRDLGYGSVYHHDLKSR